MIPLFGAIAGISYELSATCRMGGENRPGQTIARTRPRAEAASDDRGLISRGADNAPLKEVAVALRQLCCGDTGVLLSELEKAAVVVAAAASRTIPLSKAIVDEHVFTNESGIHVHGLLKDPAQLRRARLGAARALPPDCDRQAFRVRRDHLAAVVQLSFGTEQSETIPAPVRKHAIEHQGLVAQETVVAIWRDIHDSSLVNSESATRVARSD